MNITLNTNRFNSQNYQYNNMQNPQRAYKGYVNQTFTGLNPVDALPSKSKFLSKFKGFIDKSFDSFTTGIAKFYTTKLYTSPISTWLASHTEKLSGVVDHMQVLGSVIISGMYMSQTLRNKDFDDDRKKTLAINQGLTFGVSTLGSYIIDSSLDNWWEKITQKYAAKQMNVADLPERIAKVNESIIKGAEQKYGKSWKALTKKQRPKLMDTLKYIEENVPNTGIESKIRGMGVLKKLLIFGTVYRFLSPVAVTPLASMMGNRLSEMSKARKNAANEAKSEENKQNVKTAA